jgi:hypothetical protein
MLEGSLSLQTSSHLGTWREGGGEIEGGESAFSSSIAFRKETQLSLRKEKREVNSGLKSNNLALA